MTYETVATFAQQAGSLYFMGVFMLGVLYAFWPRKHDEFRRAARIPLDQDLNDDRPL